MQLRHHESFYFKQSVKPLSNPGRGFYIQLNSEKYERMPMLAEQVRLVLLAFDIKGAGDQPIEEEKLQELELALQAAEQQRVTVIFRAYGFEPDVDEPESLESVGMHIAQISQLLNRYRPQIAVVQAGMLGQYGEWHGGRFLSSDEVEEAERQENRLYILRQWEKYLDATIKVAVRRPRFIREAQEEGILINRLSLHNDALLSTESDMGTYDDPQMDTEAELAWIEEHLADQYNGGEMPVLGERSQPANAHQELQQFHASYVNLMYNEEVIEYWKQADILGTEQRETAFSFIERHLGYRLYVEEISVRSSLMDFLRGREGRVEILLRNSGYAALPAEYKLYLELQDADGERCIYQIDSEELYTACNGESIRAAIDLPKMEDGTVVGFYLQIAADVRVDEKMCAQLANDEFPFENGVNQLLVLQKEDHKLNVSVPTQNAS